MRDLLDQLYKTKLQLLAVLSTVGGIALLLLAQWTDTVATPSWLTADRAAAADQRRRELGESEPDGSTGTRSVQRWTGARATRSLTAGRRA